MSLNRVDALRVVVPICGGQVATMIGAFAFPALLPTFIADWSLSNAEAGWIAGIFFAANAVAAPVLITLTDRMDARRIFLGSAALGIAAHLAFVWLAQGFWSALILRALVGVSLAGTYMPGLRMMVDRIPESARARAVPFYTSAFSLGAAVSFLVSGGAADLFGWPLAFAVAAGGMAVGLAVAALQPTCVPEPLAEGATATRLLDFRPVLRNRAAMGFIGAYAAHCWELFAFRSWTVALLAAAVGLTVAADDPPQVLAPSNIATLAALVAMAASLIGAEIATRRGRAVMCRRFMTVSAIGSCAIGFLIGLPYPLLVLLVLVYSAVIQLDSAALTTGAVETAEDGRRGATLAVHSFVGFMAGFLGPLVLGVILDVAGTDVTGWGMAFASLGLVGFLGTFALKARKT